MPNLTITIEVPWPKHPTLAALEKAIFKALMAAGRQLLQKAFELIEQQLLTDGAGTRQRRRRRYLVCRFGELRFHRWQVQGRDGYRCPLDRALGLEPGDPCSPWVRAKSALLAQAHPYRQAASLLSQMIGSQVDHRRLWGWVQQSGGQLLGSWQEQRDRLFRDGELPPPQGQAPGIVSTAVDGTFIRTRDGPVEVKLGVWWTGAHLESETARHSRYLLDGKGFYAACEDADTFGQGFYMRAEQATGISQAKEVFLVSDGAGWCGEIAPDWVGPTAWQLDHFHGKQRITEVAKDPERAARWWSWVAENNLDALGKSLKHCLTNGQIDPEAGRSLMGYFRRGAGALRTYLRLRDAGHSAQMAPRGSGVIEHSVDLVVARRFKRQGMRSWTRTGANNLLALRVLAKDPEAWRSWWGEAAM